MVARVVVLVELHCIILCQQHFNESIIKLTPVPKLLIYVQSWLGQYVFKDFKHTQGFFLYLWILVKIFIEKKKIYILEKSNNDLYFRKNNYDLWCSACLPQFIFNFLFRCANFNKLGICIKEHALGMLTCSF